MYFFFFTFFLDTLFFYYFNLVVGCWLNTLEMDFIKLKNTFINLKILSSNNKTVILFESKAEKIWLCPTKNIHI